jgi:hypothetical protein
MHREQASPGRLERTSSLHVISPRPSSMHVRSGTLTLETHRAGLVASCKTTLLVDHEQCCDELVGLAEQQKSGEDLQKCECFLQDVGSFLEYTTEVTHQQPTLAEAMATLNAIEAPKEGATAKDGSGKANQGEAGAVVSGSKDSAVLTPGMLSEQEQQRHNELVVAQAFDRCECVVGRDTLPLDKAADGRE